jgi:coiled-coil domain-containing protein 55
MYQKMLEEDAERHAAAVAATTGSTAGPSLAIRPPTKEEYEPEAEYDPLLARQEKDRSKEAGTSSLSDQTGKQIDVNDDGEVVDKRSLLKAGLNIMKKPSPALPSSLLAGQRSGSSLEGPYKSRAVGSAASYQERMERERKRLADQMREEQEKKRAAEEARIREEEEAARRRREGDDGEAQRKREEARQKYLERKRQREEEAKGCHKRVKEG